jgi:hypothetical protein
MRKRKERKKINGKLYNLRDPDKLAVGVEEYVPPMWRNNRNRTRPPNSTCHIHTIPGTGTETQMCIFSFSVTQDSTHTGIVSVFILTSFPSMVFGRL